MNTISRYIMTVLYVAAGINHFVHPQFYSKIMPRWLPWHPELIFISGMCEVLFALLLLPFITRRLGAWCIIALLIAIFPANIQMTVDYFQAHKPGFWLTVLRLPLQIVLVWWAYQFTKTAKAV